MGLATSAESGVGITLAYKLGSGSFISLVTLLDDCEFGGQTVAAINIPYLASLTLPKIPGRLDSGDFTASLAFFLGDAGIVELITLFQARTTCMWQIMLPDGTSGTTGSTAVFSGFITSFKPGGFTGEDTPKLDITIAISGPITFTPGT